MEINTTGHRTIRNTATRKTRKAKATRKKTIFVSTHFTKKVFIVNIFGDVLLGLDIKQKCKFKLELTQYRYIPYRTRRKAIDADKKC